MNRARESSDGKNSVVYDNDFPSEEDEEDLERYFQQKKETRAAVRKRLQRTDYGSKVAFFYQEGDEHNPPLRLMITNQRYPSMDLLLAYLNRKVRMPRGVRAIFSPKGRHIVDQLDDIENNGHYICSSNKTRGLETDITTVRQPPRPWLMTKTNRDRHPVKDRHLYGSSDNVTAISTMPPLKRSRQEVYYDQATTDGEDEPTKASKKRSQTLQLPDILPRRRRKAPKRLFPPYSDDEDNRHRGMPSDQATPRRSDNGDNRALPRITRPPVPTQRRTAWPEKPPVRTPVSYESITGGDGRHSPVTKRQNNGFQFEDDPRGRTPAPAATTKKTANRNFKPPQPVQQDQLLWPSGIGYRGDDYVLPPAVYQQHQEQGTGIPLQPNREGNKSKEVKPAPRRQNKARDYGRAGNTAGHNQQFTVRLVSGDMPNGASSSNVMLTIYGQNGSSPTISFTPKRKAFLSNSSEVYNLVRLPSDIGEIYKIRLEISNTGSNPDWLCEEVQIEDEVSKEVIRFPCRRWLSSNMGDRHIIREIPALTQNRPPVALVHYEVTVQTGNIYNAGTNGKVTIILYGERGDSGPRLLKNPINAGKIAPFAKNQADVFVLESVSLGELRRLRVQHEPESPQLGWYLENIVVREKDLHSTFVFGGGRWINARDDDRQLTVDLKATDFLSYYRYMDKKWWPAERWKFKMPLAEVVLLSCVSNKPLRVTNGGFIDARAEPQDKKEGNAAFVVQVPDDQDNESIVALKSVSKAPAFIAFSNQKIVSKAGYSPGCDLRIHALATGAVTIESDKYPSNYISVASNGQMYPETQVTTQPGPNQQFFCHVKGCFRENGVVMLCSSRMQTLSIDRDPSALTACGGRNRLAHFRVHKVAVGGVRMFESIVFPGNFIQLKKNVVDCMGVGDRFCEFKVRRFRELGFVMLESLRERGTLGFSPAGRARVETHLPSPPPQEVRLYPEIIEFGRKKGGDRIRQAVVREDTLLAGSEHDPDSDLNSEIDDLYRDRYRGKPGRKVPVVYPPRRPLPRQSVNNETESESLRPPLHNPRKPPGPVVARAPQAPQHSEVFSPSRKPIRGLKPTLTPWPGFIPKDDCTVIRKAITRGDLDPVIKIICRRTGDQRVALAKTYKDIIKKELLEDILTVENVAELAYLLPHLFVPYVTHVANDINKGLQGDVDEIGLIEIICSNSDEELHQIKQEYQKKFGQALDTMIMESKTTPFAQRLLARLLARPPSVDAVVQAAMESDSKTLHKMFDVKVDRPEDHFLFSLLAGRSHVELKAICDCYKKLFQVDVEEHIAKIPGEAAKYLTAAVRCITKMQTYFAERLNDILAKDANSAALDRIILQRCEVDTENIKSEFEKLYSATLARKLQIKITGNRLTALLSLLNAKGSEDLMKQAKAVMGKSDFIPTVIPEPNFSAKMDIDLLNKSLKAGKTEEIVKDLISVLTKRSWHQRLELSKFYKDVTKKDLDKEVEAVTQGFFSKLMLRLLRHPLDTIAADLNTAMRGSDERALIEIICTTPTTDLQSVKERYQKMFGRTLQKDLEEVKDPYRKLLVQIINRPKASTDSTIDETVAEADAKALQEEVSKGTLGVEYLTRFFTSNRASNHFKMVFDCYKKDFYEDIEDDLDQHFKDELGIAFRACVFSIKNRPAYFARRLNSYIHDKENRNAALFRLIPSRCEVDLGSIKIEYRQIFNKDLKADAQTTPEDYGAAIVSLIEGNATGISDSSGGKNGAPPPNLPTVYPDPKFNVKQDCQALQGAIKSGGTKGDVLVEILTKRSWQQRAEIEKTYKETFKKEIENEMDGEVGGNFLKVLLKLLKLPAELAARELNAALQAKENDCLVEIICTTSHAELQAIKDTYEKLFKSSLQSDIEKATNGHFEKILVALVNRPKSPETLDGKLIKNDAKAMIDAIVEDSSKGVNHLTKLFATRGQAQLRAIFDTYEKDFGADIEDDIKKHFGGEVETAFITVVQAIRNKPKYYANRLNVALLSSTSVNHSAMIRQIIARCEIDLGNIKFEYEKQFGKPLVKVVEAKTSGDYRTALISLINGNKPPKDLTPRDAKPKNQQQTDTGKKAPEEQSNKTASPPGTNFIPTLIDEPKFDPKKDCEAIVKAMKGIGTDEDSLTAILTRRTYKQRLEIMKVFKADQKKDLEKEIASEVNGSYLALLKALLKSPVELTASGLKVAMKGAGTDEGVLIEIICGTLHADFQQVRDKYNQMYHVTLEKDVEGDTNGAFQKLLLALINRPKSPGNVDLKVCKSDAKTVHDGMAKGGTAAANQLTTLLATRGQAQLQVVFDFYKQDFKSDIEDDIKKNFSGDSQDAFLGAVAAIRNKHVFLAKRYMKAMEGIGTNDEDLIRLTVTRCEIDLGNIKTEYEKLNKKTLVIAVEGETSGDYQKALVSLINGNNVKNIPLKKSDDPGAKVEEKKSDVKKTPEVESYKLIQPPPYQAYPTLIDEPKFEAKKDCEALKKAMKSIGTNEDALTNILTKRSYHQRSVIANTYKGQFKKDLMAEIKGECSGNYYKLLEALMKPSLDFAALELKNAMKGAGTNEDTLIEIICSKTHPDLQLLKEKYQKLFNSSLQKDVESETSGDFQKLLLALINRPKSPDKVDDKSIWDDIKALHQSITNGGEKAAEDVTKLFASRGHRQLRLIFENYTSEFKTDVEEDIKSRFNSDLEKAFLATIESIRNKDVYFANRFNDAMKGAGTRDSALIRLVVSRCEVDLGGVKAQYERLYKKPLVKVVDSETSGDYKKALISLLNGNNPVKPPVPKDSKLVESDKEKAKQPAAKPEQPAKTPPDYVAIPTVVPEPKFDAKKDCEILMKAMKGIGTNEAALDSVLTKRSWKQREEIEKTYKEVYKKDLTSEIKSETDGDYFKVLESLLKTPLELAAQNLKNAVKGAGTDEECLIEIICSRTHEDLQLLKEKYQTMFKTTLQKDIEDDTSGAFQKLLVALINRPKSPSNIDLKAAKVDVKALHEAISKGGDEAAQQVTDLLARRGQAQLRVIFHDYTHEFGGDVVEDIKKHFKDDLQTAFVATVEAIRNKASFYANRFNDAMKGVGTKDDDLIRLVVSRCEFDLGTIKAEYEKLFKQPLIKAVESETSGDYKNCLVSLLNGNAPTATDKPKQAESDKEKAKQPEQPAKTPPDYVAVPTVVPEPKFDAKKDCEVLMKAMKGIGTNEAALDSVLTKRSWKQREEIVKTYKVVYKKELVSEIKSETDGSYFKVLESLLKSPLELAAQNLKNATKGAGTDEECLIEIICSRTHEDLQLLKEKYQKMFKTTLQKDVEGDTSGAFQKLLVALINRPKSPSNIDLKAAKVDVKTLHEAISKGGEEAAQQVTDLLAKRGQSQLRVIFHDYSHEFGSDVAEDIKKHFKDDLQKAFVATVEVIRNKAAFFANRFNDSMKGLGTKDDDLIRLVVSRCEFDLGTIKTEFEKLFKQPLIKAVESETSGDYKNCLVSLLNGNAQPPAAAKDNKTATKQVAFSDHEETKGENQNTTKEDKTKVKQIPAKDDKQTKPDQPAKMPPDYSAIPTVVAEPKFDAKADCEVLMKAMKGIGTNESALDSVLTRRSWKQRSEIDKAYKEIYKKDLTSEIKSETDGDYFKILESLLKSPLELAAQNLKNAMKGVGTDEECLIEIICSKSHEDLQLLKEKYQKMFKTTLQKDVEGDTSGAFQKLLVALINRPKSPLNIDLKAAKVDVKTLHEAISKGGDEAVQQVTDLFANRGQTQLRVVFYDYTHEFGSDIVEDIKKHFKDDLQKAFVATVEAIRNKGVFYANRFNDAMKGVGTKDDDLIRLVVSRSEIDLGTIKTEYEKLFKKPLIKAVESETSGDYKNCLVSLLNGNKDPALPNAIPSKATSKPSEKAAESLPAKKTDDKMLPTVVAEPNFDVKKDCEVLMKAMKGLGTDEDSLTGVLTKRSWQQRGDIEATYKEVYKKDLEAEIKSETGGSYFQLLSSLLKTPVELAAMQLNGAMKGAGTDEQTLIEIICTKPYADLQMIMGKYEFLYKKSLQSDIENDISGAFQKLLVALINRPKSPNSIDVKAARADAKAVHDAIAQDDDKGADELIKLFSSRGQSQLRLIFDSYEGSIEDDIEKHFSGDIKPAFLAVVGSIRNKPLYFAKRFNEAMEGVGTRDEALIRLVVSRCEVDLGNVKEEFVKLYAKPLVKAVESETSGDYKNALVSLINGNNTSGTHLTIPPANTKEKELTVTKDSKEKERTITKEKENAKERTITKEPATKQSTSKPQQKDEEKPEQPIPPSRPTVVADPNFDVTKDCETLMKAMKGIGTNEDAITAVLTKRSWQQRAEIETSFRSIYQKDLESEIKSEVSGNYLRLLHALLKTPTEYSARELNAALKSKDAATKDDTLIEVICSKSHADLQLIKEKYLSIFETSLQSDIEVNTAGKFQELMVALINRPKSPETRDPVKAREDAKVIHELLQSEAEDKGSKATDELTKLFANRGQAQLRLMFQKYETDFKANLEADIEKHFDGSVEKAYVAVVNAVRNKPLYFAKRFNAAMEGKGTRDDALIRLVVSRCEIDLSNIKEEFEKLYSKPLVKIVESETSGDYQRAMIALIHGNNTNPLPQPETANKPTEKEKEKENSSVAKEPEKERERTVTKGPAPGRKPSDAKPASVAKKEADDVVKDEAGHPPIKPTVVAEPNFDVAKDCETLMKAVKGLRPDALITIPTKRSWQQRAEIEATYRATYQKDLESEIKLEVGGNYLQTLLALLKTPTEYAARELNTALKGKDAATKDDTLIEVICTKSHADLQVVKEKYQSIFNKSLQSDIEANATGKFQSLMVALVNRPKSPETSDPKKAREDAEVMYNLLHGEDTDKGSKATDELTKLFANRGQAQLRLIFQKYETDFKANLEADIVKHFDGSVEKAFVAVVSAVRNKPLYFAKRFSASMEGAGTRHEALIRLVVSRCEVDLGNVKEEFEKLYSKPLAKAVESETSGDYQKALLSLINGNVPPFKPAGKENKENTVTKDDFVEEKPQKPTLIANANFDVVRDCETLMKAMKGIGTDGDAITTVLTKRSWQQRAEIETKYRATYQKDLESEIRNEVGGNYLKLLQALLKTPTEYAARELNAALKSKDSVTRDETLIEVICTKSHADLQVTKEKYQSIFETSLQSDIEANTTGKFQSLLVALLNRPKSPETRDPNKAKEDAKVIYDLLQSKDAAKGLKATDEMTKLFASRGQAQLRLIFQKYDTDFKANLEGDIVKYFDGAVEKAFVTVVNAVRNKPLYFAKRLHAALEGTSVNDETIIRIVVSRCEIDLGSIKDEFENFYQKPLVNVVENKTTGDYEKALIFLINGNVLKTT